jgi:tRNA U34 5-methylaminomethyl-2-thiouridine-forming methyltransferase MnmC
MNYEFSLFPQLTKDGSFTFFSQEFGEKFHSESGAKQEAEKKFVQTCQLAELAQVNSSLKLLDICYGLGYNTASALQTIWSVNPHCQVELIALELNPCVPRQAIAHQLLCQWSSPIPQLLKILADSYDITVKTPKLNAQLWIGDARITIQQVYQSGFQADAIFLDPFSPTKCPQLWTVEFLSWVARCLKPTGRLATYSCATSVRTALRLAGLNIGPTASVGRRSPGTVASFNSDQLQSLSWKEKEHLCTRAAIPYRDPQLKDSAKIIIQRRVREQQISFLEPTNHWKKRWLNQEH